MSLFCENSAEWANVIGLMKGTRVWEEVKRMYPELEGDDAVAEEVLAWYSGRRGAERLRAEREKAVSEAGSVFDKAAAISMFERIRRGLERFWRAVADMLHIHFRSAEEVADRVMYDMLRGFNPNEVKAEFGKSEEGRVKRDERDAAGGEVRDGAAMLKAQELDRENGTEISRFIDYLDRGELQSGESRYFHVGHTGALLNGYGISGKITISSAATNTHHNKDADHMDKYEWVEVFDKVNEPIAITRYGNRKGSYRIYTIVEKNGKNVCVGIDVNSVGRNVNITTIKTAFAREIKNALNEELIYPGSREELETVIQELSLRHNREVYPEQPLSGAKVGNNSESSKSEEGVR
ncbi:MAG: hypothetical protein ACI4SO_06260, partial [Muribaculaceae bacterium]